MNRRVIQGSFSSGAPLQAAMPGAHRQAPHVAAARSFAAPTPQARRPASHPSPSHRRPGVQLHSAQPYRGGQAFRVESQSLDLTRAGAGRPLPPAVQTKMEQAFGANFADVRVHQGPEASSIGALAFTYGNDLYFAAGQYNPATVAGQRLLAHELTHVVQQRSGRVANPFGGGVAVVQDPQLEAEAEQAARRFGSGAAVQRQAAPGVGRAGVVQRATPLELWSTAYLHKEAAKTAMGQVQEIADAIKSGKIGDTDELTNLGRASTLNSDGLADKLEAISRETKGHYAELGLLYNHLKGNKGAAIIGKYADVSLRDSSSSWTAFQVKYVSTFSATRVNQVIGKAAEQLAGKHGEKPKEGSWLTARISLESHNPWPFDDSPGSIPKDEWKAEVLKKVKRMRKKDLLRVERIEVVWPQGRWTDEGKLQQIDVFKSFFDWDVEIKSFKPFTRYQLGQTWVQQFTGY